MFLWCLLYHITLTVTSAYTSTACGTGSEDFQTLMQLAQAAMRTDTEKAVTCYAAAVKRDPKSYDAWAGMHQVMMTTYSPLL